MADITENALEILKARYFRRDIDGNAKEDWSGLCRRVADFIASAEPASAEVWRETYYNLLHSLTFLPNSPTLFNADMPLGNLSACFVLPVGDSLEEIFGAITNAALIFATGGGCGYSFSELRKRGSPVSRTNGVSSGPVSFIQAFNACTEVIKQGGKRRGANMGVLRVDHPDIVEFLDSKKVEGTLTNFNLSVAVTDEFMKAVEADDNFTLFDGYTNKPDSEVKAKYLFDKIVEGAWSNGEPGVVFVDEINRRHPLQGLGEISGVNPCIGKGTLISTSRGLVPIETVGEGDLVLTRNGRFATVLRLINNGVKPVVELKTRRGFSIRVTPDHEMWTSEGWISADRCLDKRLVLQRWESFGLRSMDGNLAELLGFWFGDGSAGERVQFAFGHNEFLAQKYRDILNSQFGCKVNITVGRGKNLIPNLRAVTGKQNAVEFFGRYRHKEVIPGEILEGTREVQASFLRGLFAADGHVERAGGMSAIALTCVNEVIIDQVMLMLLNFGIVCRKYRSDSDPVPGNIYNLKGTVCYRLQFAGQFREIFTNEIGVYKKVPSTKTYHLNGEADTVVSIDDAGECEVYDLTVDDETHSFIANGVAVSNCGEQPLLPNEPCNLGSINLTKFFKQPLSSPQYYAADVSEDYRANIDWANLGVAVTQAVRFLDDVITVNRYPIQEITDMSLKTRKIGLGIMGWADLLLMLRIDYSSNRATRLADRLIEWIQFFAIDASVKLAKDRGTFPAYEEHYDPKPRPHSSWEGTLDWNALDEAIKEHGLRNACITTIAPTGTLSLIAGVSSGIEPNFQWEYNYHRIDREFTEVHWLARQFLSLDEPLPSYFKTSLEIEPSWHVKMQAVFQRWVDAGISKTINLPFDATREDVAEAIMLGWKSKIKGMTLYRSGSRAKEVLVRKGSKPVATTGAAPRERPTITNGSTMRVAVGDNCGSMFVTINFDSVGPCESFVALGRGGGCISSHTEALGRMISLALRSGIEPVQIIDQLRGIRCSKPRWVGGGDVIRSCPDAVASAFTHLLSLGDNDSENDAKYVSAVALGENPECPECHGELMVEARCLYCRSCGYSKCG